MSAVVETLERWSQLLSQSRKPAVVMASLLALALFFNPHTLFSQPDIQIDEQDFECDVRETFQAEFSFNLTNSGDEDLLWHSRERIISLPHPVAPRRDEPGEILDRFTWQRAGRNNLKAGIGYDPATQLVILTSFQNSYYGILNPANDFQVVREWQSGQSLLGATCLNGVIYAINAGQEWFQRWDIEGNDLGRLNTGRYAPVTVTASNEEDLLFFMDFDGSNCLIVMTPAGEIVGRIEGGELFDDNPLGGIVWVDDHREGHLWYVSRSSHRVFQMQVEARAGDQFNPAVIQSFDIPDVIDPHELDGIGHDGDNLIFGIRGRSDYLVVDDGLGEQYWLTWEPKRGVLTPEEDGDVFVLFNMAGMIQGDYEAEIHVYSNDPDTPDLVLNILTHVAGIPDITITWPEAAGFPDFIDFDDFNFEVWAGYESTVPLTIENTGTADVIVDEIAINSRVFTAEPSQFVVTPGEEVLVEVILNSPQSGLYEGRLTLTSNDADQAVIEIPVRGLTADPPAIGVDTQNILILPDSDSTSCAIDIRNDGASTLRWWSTITSLSDQNPDDSGMTIVTGEPDFGGLEPGAHAELWLRFQRVNLHRPEDDFILTIESNDPSTEKLIVNISIRWVLEIQDAANRIHVPSTLFLASPYPNPFNSSANLAFSLPQNGMGDLRLYSSEGREITTLATGYFVAGWQSVVIDANSLPAGIYLARLRVGGESATSRVVVVK